jgi:hypothetical protein
MKYVSVYAILTAAAFGVIARPVQAMTYQEFESCIHFARIDDPLSIQMGMTPWSRVQLYINNPRAVHWSEEFARAVDEAIVAGTEIPYAKSPIPRYEMPSAEALNECVEQYILEFER